MLNMRAHFEHRGPHRRTKKGSIEFAIAVFFSIYMAVIYVATFADPLPRMTLPLQILNGEGKPLTRIVNTKYGALRGFVATLPNRPSKPVDIFLGIPYASPPVASLRFMPPVTPSHWRGIRSASKFSPVCPQNPPDIRNETEALKVMTIGRLQFLKRLIPYLHNQSEDCLYLNIYAPSQQRRERPKVPVLVFIHGESFEWNAGNPYDGSVLASFGNVVVVTVNFRLGVLGFLPAGEGSSRGNYALTDQIAALHWVQENIAEFGGDPTNVTLFGHGHGAACVNFLVLSPMAKVSTLFPLGLFHRAIMMSGSALSPWAVAHNAHHYAEQVARTLGCPVGQTSKVLACMRERSVADILRVKLFVPTFLSGFGPTVDGIVILNNPLNLMEDLAHETQHGIFELMFGVTRVETYNLANAQDEKYGIDLNRRDRFLRTLVRNIFDYHLQEIFLTIVNEYTDWTKAIQHAITILDGTLDAVGDGLYVSPTIKAANYHATGPRTSFFYVFSYQSENGEYPSRQGCIHGDDLQYVFGAPLVGKLGPFTQFYNRTEINLAEAVMTYWVNFAKNGDPNSVEAKTGAEKPRGRFEKIVWNKYEKVQQKFLMIGPKPKVRDHYHAHRLSFWLNLFPQLHASSFANISPEHHLLDDHDNMMSYDGIVRQLPYYISTTPGDDGTTEDLMNITGLARRGRKTALTTVPPSDQPINDKAVLTETTTAASDNQGFILSTGNYSAALSVTIAVGCSLLILNVLIFVGIYFQRDRGRRQPVVVKRPYGVFYLPQEPSEGQAMDPCSTPQGKQLTLRAPPPSPVCNSMPQELPLHPPAQSHFHHHHPHKVLPKPCSVPLPPQIPKKESLIGVESQPLLEFGICEGAASVVAHSPKKNPFFQEAQVHHQPTHAEYSL